jgi:hypothetical protein
MRLITDYPMGRRFIIYKWEDGRGYCVYYHIPHQFDVYPDIREHIHLENTPITYNYHYGDGTSEIGFYTDRNADLKTALEIAHRYLQIIESVEIQNNIQV